jgi:hypothetical protein
MPSRRSLAHASVRVVAGLVGVAVAGACILAASWLPLPSYTSAVPSARVAPVPTDQQRVCPGPILQLAADSTDATSASAFGSPRVIFGSSSGAVDTRSLKAPDDSAADRFGGPETLSLAAAAGQTAPPLIAGSQSQTAVQEDLAGLTAIGCGEATRSSWLVAGATDLGQSSLVLLNNPTAVQASVDLTVFSESGAVEAPGAQGILVDPGTQRAVALAGIAPNIKGPVVHVTSRGGSVLATMQQSVVRGLTPGGVELVSPTSAPARHQVISGLTVGDLVAQAGAVEAYSDVLPALRVLAPGDKTANVRVGIVPEKGTVGGSSTQATVRAKTTQEIPLDRLVSGSFTVVIDSDEPVVVAARTSTTGASGDDFAWYAASRPLAGDTMIAVAAGPDARIHLANQAAKDATVSLRSTDGSVTNDVTVTANSAVGIPVRAGLMYTVTGATGLYASVSYSGNGLSSSFPIRPPGALASPITVYPR